MLSKPLHVDSKGPRVPCNFYDVPGLVQKETQMEKNLDRIIEGLLVIDDKVVKKSQNISRQVDVSVFTNPNLILRRSLNFFFTFMCT